MTAKEVIDDLLKKMSNGEKISVDKPDRGIQTVKR